MESALETRFGQNQSKLAETNLGHFCSAPDYFESTVFNSFQSFRIWRRTYQPKLLKIWLNWHFYLLQAWCEG